jgi:hypothetical protein
LLLAALCTGPLGAEESAGPGAAAAPAAAPALAPSDTPPTPPAAPGAAAAASGSPSTAEAARLWFVGEARGKVFIDKPTVRKLTSDKTELWAEMHFENGERTKFLMQINCGDRSYLVKSEVVYGSGGEVVESRTHRAPALQYVVPDSVSEVIHRAICRPG